MPPHWLRPIRSDPAEVVPVTDLQVVGALRAEAQVALREAVLAEPAQSAVCFHGFTTESTAITGDPAVDLPAQVVARAVPTMPAAVAVVSMAEAAAAVVVEVAAVTLQQLATVALAEVLVVARAVLPLPMTTTVRLS